jgi:hypothetical protein
LAKQKEIWAKELQNAEGLYGNRIATGKQQYEESKAAYNNSVMNMNAGLLESPTQIVADGVAQQAAVQQQPAVPYKPAEGR